MRFDLVRCALLLILVALIAPSLARAHAVTNSRLTLAVEDRQVSGKWYIKLKDLDPVVGLDTDGDRRISDEELAPRAQAMYGYLLAKLELSDHAAPCATRPVQHTIDGPNLVFEFEGACSPQPNALTLRYDLFFDHDANHQGHLSLLHAGERETAIFTAGSRTREFDVASAEPRPWWSALREYLVQGVWHIWIGIDHILFLVALLLPAVLVRRNASWQPVRAFWPACREVLRIVTAFTVAHSITLSLAALGVVQPDVELVESVIALSIVLAAFLNLYPIGNVRGWVVAFVFGLVHGFGFANVLVELGLPIDQFALALFAFNVGVEVGQLAIVVAFLPLAFLTRKLRAYEWIALRLGSALVAALALVWFLERAFGLSGFPDPSNDAPLVPLAAWILLGLAVISLTVLAPAPTVSRKWIVRGFGGSLALISAAVAVALTAVPGPAGPAHATKILARFGQAPVHESGSDDHGRAAAVRAVFGAGWIGEQSLLPQLDQALARLEQADDSSLLDRLAETGDPTEAIGVLDQLLADAHRDAAIEPRVDIQRERAVLLSLRDSDAAIAQLRDLVESSGDLPSEHQLALLLARAGQLDATSSRYETLARRAESQSNPALAATAWSELGSLHQIQGDVDRGAPAFKRATEVYAELGDDASVAATHARLGQAYLAANRWSEAWPAFETAARMHAELGDQLANAQDVSHLGDLGLAGADLAVARTRYHEALELYRDLEHPTGIAAQYRNLAVVAQLAEDPSQATSMYRRALEIHEAQTDRPAMARDLMQLGLLYKGTRQYAEAESMFTRAVELDRHLGREDSVAHHLSRLGNIYQIQDDLDRAESSYEAALAIYEQTQRPVKMAKDYANLANIHRMRGQFDRAEELYRLSVNLFQKNDATGDARRVEGILRRMGANG
ncbi:MAG: tetratricopeptide repeat protein [Myxococcales bacterium FL481]|nr:MAG: tetratricopeptide repeat protein [Myxococcales bacterium FL481]